MKGQRIKAILESTNIGDEYQVQGWVRTFRANRFIALNDGSTLNNLQCVVDFEKLEDALLKQINTGAALKLNGILTESQGSGQKVELQVNKIEILDS